MPQPFSGLNKIGLDLVEISRFKQFDKKTVDHRLRKIFTKLEISYCFQYKSPASHLAGIFAAKEASSKALGAVKFPFVELEIRHGKDGSPQVWKKGRRLSVSVSITHTRDLAAAIAII